MQITLEAIYNIDVDAIPDDLRADLAAHYNPTPESPEPDDEWIAEELAMRRVDETGLEMVTVVDNDAWGKGD